MSAIEAQRAAPGASPARAGSAARPRRGRRDGARDRWRAAARRPPRGRCRGRPAPRGRARRTAARRAARTPPAALAGQQRAEQRQRDAAQHRGRVEHLARRGSSPSRYSAASSCTTVGSTASSGASGRSRTADAASCSDSGCPRTKRLTHSACVLVEPGAAQHLGRVGGRQRPERHGAQQLAERRPPDGARRVARGDHDARVRGQRRQERLAQPAVEQPQPLGGVDHEHDRAVGARARPTAARKPCGVGSIARPSTATTARRARSPPRGRRAAATTCPTPATPWTTATTGAVVLEQLAQRRQLASRPTTRRARARPAALRASGHAVRPRGPARGPAR